MDKRAGLNAVAEEICGEFDYKYEAFQAISSVFRSLTTLLRAGKAVEIRGFGIFEPTKIPAHHGWNPKTGEQMIVPERVKVKFRPGHKLKGIDPKDIKTGKRL